MDKKYYLHPYRFYLAGIIIILLGLMPFWISLLSKDPPGEWIEIYIPQSFSAKSIVSVLPFYFLLGLGVYFFKNAKKMLVAKLDEKGVYYPKIFQRPKQTAWNLFWINPQLEHIPYNKIESIELIKSKWFGYRIAMTTKDEKKIIDTLDRLSLNNKKDLIEIVRSRV